MGRGMHQKSKDRLEAAVEILEQIQPAGVRAVCYKLFTMGLIPDMSTGSTQVISKLLRKAREDEDVPWEWITDDTRPEERASQWDDPVQIFDAATRGYRLDYWNEQPHRVVVISEKSTIRGTIAPVLDDLGVAFRVQRGYGSATAVHKIAEEIASADRFTHLLYMGDHDPSGMHMSEADLPERLSRYGAGGRYLLKRIALTPDDVRKSELPGFPLISKAKDPRCPWYRARYGTRCWELDALDPRIIRERLREEIEALIDPDAWNHCMRIEAVQRESMQDFMGAIRQRFNEGNSI